MTEITVSLFAVLFSDDGDVIDYILPRLIDQTRTRRAILKQLKWLGIIETSKDLKEPKAPYVAL